MADFAAHISKKYKTLDLLPFFAGGYSTGGLVSKRMHVHTLSAAGDLQ